MNGRVGVSKNRVYPKMDGENNGKPYFLNGMIWGVLTHYFRKHPVHQDSFRTRQLHIWWIVCWGHFDRGHGPFEVWGRIGKEAAALWVWRANKAVVQAVKTPDFWVWVVLVYFFASQQFFTDVFLFCGHVFLVKVVSLKIFMEKTHKTKTIFFFLGGEDNLF